jgi:tripartite-type tricarboxylate transporter receptor subunit TctC
MDSRICQTTTASPAKPGGLPLTLGGATAFLIAAPGAAKQSPELAEYPVRPIHIVVASSPGTADDFFARALASELEGFYRQRVVIDNRSGAGGLIGNTLVSRSNADGYTLGMVGVTRIISELVREQPPYRALADIVGVAHVA